MHAVALLGAIQVLKWLLNMKKLLSEFSDTDIPNIEVHTVSDKEGSDSYGLVRNGFKSKEGTSQRQDKQDI